ncbi:MAG TPA: Smr/MutS family protein [Caulobacteraceae bacterium]|nr:Smr/MutS family protein [Caulobacteraceae bacterium]
MRRPDEEGESLWRAVTATVRPLPGRRPPEPASLSGPLITKTPQLAMTLLRRAQSRAGPAAKAIEPVRRRRLERGRDVIGARIDLHGLGQDEAKAALRRFIARSHHAGVRSLLVITGKGALGDGVLRRRVPEWLAEPPLVSVVAGLSHAHQRHGGQGALYVALKRTPPG